jgi:hypothetical protein
LSNLQTTRVRDRRTNAISGGLPDPASLSRAMSSTPKRYGQWLGAVIAVIAAVILGGWLYANKGGVSEVLVIDHAIPAGHAITKDDLGSANVSGVKDAVPVADLDDVLGQRAAVALVPGQVLTHQAVTAALLPGDAQRLIAVSIPQGRVPATLTDGTAVDVVAVPQPGEASDTGVLDNPKVISSGATVYAVKSAEDGSAVVTLLLSAVDANQVAAYGSVGRLTLVQSPLESGDQE